MPSIPLIKYVLMAAVRDRLIVSMIVMLLITSCLSIFFGGAAIIEKDQFTLVFTASSLRLVSVLSLVLFLSFFVRRSFDSKDIEFLLSRPVGRLSIIFSYSTACMILAFLVALASAVCVLATAPHLISVGHTYWFISLVAENIIMVNMALFFSMYISSSATSSLVTLCAYVLARMMGQFLGIVDSDLVDSLGIYAMAIQIVSTITPRLDLLAQSSWLIYGVDQDINIFMIVFQAVTFSFLVLMAASLDFFRRQF